MVQIKIGSSNQIGTGGILLAYRRSGFREVGSSQFITLGSADQRNIESAFGAEPRVSTPGHIKRASERGTASL